MTRSLAPASVLDVGVGAGKIGKLVKQAYPQACLYGIEAEPSYASQFADTWQIYKKIFVGTAKEVSIELSTQRYDLVVFGDVLEHMWKHDALALLHYWSCRAAYVIALWPNGYAQDAMNGVTSEIHRSEITLQDLTASGLCVVRFHMHQRPGQGQFKSFAVVRGRLASPASQVGVAYDTVSKQTS